MQYKGRGQNMSKPILPYLGDERPFTSYFDFDQGTVQCQGLNPWPYFLFCGGYLVHLSMFHKGMALV